MEQTVSFLKQKGLLVKRDWLDARAQVKSTNLIYEELLNCDLDDPQIFQQPPIPWRGNPSYTLQGQFVFQITGLQNIAHEANIRVEKSVTPKRMFKLNLSSGGGQSVIGLEYQLIPSLIDVTHGTKLLLKNPQVRQGVLFLTPANTSILGGALLKKRKVEGDDLQVQGQASNNTHNLNNNSTKNPNNNNINNPNNNNINNPNNNNINNPNNNNINNPNNNNINNPNNNSTNNPNNNNPNSSVSNFHSISNVNNSNAHPQAHLNPLGSRGTTMSNNPQGPNPDQPSQQHKPASNLESQSSQAIPFSPSSRPSFDPYQQNLTQSTQPPVGRQKNSQFIQSQSSAKDAQSYNSSATNFDKNSNLNNPNNSNLNNINNSNTNHLIETSNSNSTSQNLTSFDPYQQSLPSAISQHSQLLGARPKHNQFAQIQRVDSPLGQPRFNTLKPGPLARDMLNQDFKKKQIKLPRFENPSVPSATSQEDDIVSSTCPTPADPEYSKPHSQYHMSSSPPNNEQKMSHEQTHAAPRLQREPLHTTVPASLQRKTPQNHQTAGAAPSHETISSLPSMTHSTPKNTTLAKNLPKKKSAQVIEIVDSEGELESDSLNIDSLDFDFDNSDEPDRPADVQLPQQSGPNAPTISRLNQSTSSTSKSLNQSTPSTSRSLNQSTSSTSRSLNRSTSSASRSFIESSKQKLVSSYRAQKTTSNRNELDQFLSDSDDDFTSTRSPRSLQGSPENCTATAPPGLETMDRFCSDYEESFEPPQEANMFNPNFDDDSNPPHEEESNGTFELGAKFFGESDPSDAYVEYVIPSDAEPFLDPDDSILPDKPQSKMAKAVLNPQSFEESRDSESTEQSMSHTTSERRVQSHPPNNEYHQQISKTKPNNGYHQQISKTKYTKDDHKQDDHPDSHNNENLSDDLDDLDTLLSQSQEKKETGAGLTTNTTNDDLLAEFISDSNSSQSDEESEEFDRLADIRTQMDAKVSGKDFCIRGSFTPLTSSDFTQLLDNTEFELKAKISDSSDQVEIVLFSYFFQNYLKKTPKQFSRLWQKEKQQIVQHIRNFEESISKRGECTLGLRLTTRNQSPVLELLNIEDL